MWWDGTRNLWFYFRPPAGSGSGSGGSPSSQSPNKLYKDQESLFKAVECPSCSSVALPPIVNCETGHILCSLCRPKTSKCKVCASPITNVLNIPAQELVAFLDIDCFYPACGAVLRGDKLKDHLAECPYRFVIVTLALILPQMQSTYLIYNSPRSNLKC